MSKRYLATWAADLFHRERRRKSALVCDTCQRLVPSRKTKRIVPQSLGGFNASKTETLWTCERCEAAHRKHMAEYMNAAWERTVRNARSASGAAS